MDILQVIVQRPEGVQITRRNRFGWLAGLEHVHARFGIREIRLNAINLAVHEFGGCAKEQADGSREGPVDTTTVSPSTFTAFER
jgi:hypothetical protein